MAKYRQVTDAPNVRRGKRPSGHVDGAETMPTAVREAPAAYNAELVGVRELRQNLSVYLDEVKQGRTLVVTEHGLRVAELRPLRQDNSWLDRLVAEGKVTPPTRRVADLLPVPSLKLAKPLGQALQEMRDEDPW